MWLSLLYLLVRLVLRVPSPAGDRERELELVYGVNLFGHLAAI